MLLALALILAAPPQQRERPTPQQQFESLAPRFDEFSKRRLCECPPAELKSDLVKLVHELQELNRGYTEIAAAKDPRWAIAALARIAQLYQHAAEAIEQAPVPKGLKDSPELVETYRQELANQAQPLRDRAAESLQTAEEKSKELNVFAPELDAARAAVKKKAP